MRWSWGVIHVLHMNLNLDLADASKDDTPFLYASNADAHPPITSGRINAKLKSSVKGPITWGREDMAIFQSNLIIAAIKSWTVSHEMCG
jgi:hypothetical protein